jgi:hypothetical protein
VGSNASIKPTRAGQQFVCPATSKNNATRISIKPVQPLVSPYICAYYPDNHVIGAISRGSEGRSSTGLADAPGVNDGGRIGCRNPERRERGAACSESDIRALIRSVADRCLDDHTIANMQGSHRRCNAAEVAAIKQIGIAILAQCNYQMGWCCTRNIHE